MCPVAEEAGEAWGGRREICPASFFWAPCACSGCLLHQGADRDQLLALEERF